PLGVALERLGEAFFHDPLAVLHHAGPDALVDRIRSLRLGGVTQPLQISNDILGCSWKGGHIVDTGDHRAALGGAPCRSLRRRPALRLIVVLEALLARRFT